MRLAHLTWWIVASAIAAAENVTVGLCAILKDAEPYLVEWLDYYLVALQFDAAYVYDNSPSHELRGWRARTRGHPVYGRVEVIHHPERTQLAAYRDCVRARGKEAYYALLDVDEFIVLFRHGTIGDLVREYLAPFGGALALNWILVGSADRELYAPLPVTKRFQYRDAAPSVAVKLIVARRDYDRSRNAHVARLRGGAAHHDTSAPGAVASLEVPGKPGVACCNRARPRDVALVYHYRFLSAKEYRAKICDRGRLLGGVDAFCDRKTGELRANAPPHMVPRRGDVFDDAAWRALTRKVPKYRVFDDEAWGDAF